MEIAGDILKSDRISSSQFDVDIQLQRKDQLISIDQFIVRADWADISANGLLPTTLDSVNNFLTPDSQYDLKGNCQINLASILSQLSNTLGIKEVMTISSGKLNADFSASHGQINSLATFDDLKAQIGSKNISLSEPFKLETEIRSTDSD
ncbi:MAG: hypothetical protein ACYTE8_07570, partial [Planctomycetota bacterium]